MTKKGGGDSSDKNDLTRIELMEGFEHDPDEDFSDLESWDPNAGKDFQEIASEATDPNISFPPEFKVNNEEVDKAEEESFGSDAFSQYETNSEESFSSEESEDSPPEFSTEYSSQEDNSPPEFGQNDYEQNQFSVNESDFEGGDSFSSEQSFEQEDSSFGDDSFGTDSTFDEEPVAESEPASFEEDQFSNEMAEQAQDLEFNSTSESIEPLEEKIEQAPAEEVKTELPSYQAQSVVKEVTPNPANSGQTISELQNFARNISYGDLTAEGNPPFSIIIKNLRYKEEADDILIMLKELKIISETEEDQARASLERGSYLIPRLSEYAAIIICHKLRRFHLDLLMGLSDQIQQIRTPESRTISKSSVFGDYSHSFDLSKSHIKPNDIITTTTTTLEGYEIVQYLGVVSERTVVDMDHFSHDESLESELMQHLNDSDQNKLLIRKIKLANRSAASSHHLPHLPELDTEEHEQFPRTSLKDIYQDLAYKLKAHAMTFRGNAIVGINYQITPILLSDQLNIQSKYQVSITGSVVWAVKR